MRRPHSARILSPLLVALALLPFAASIAHADDSQDSGLGGGHRYRLGLAPYLSDTNYSTDLAASGGLSEFVKADLTLDRPKHDEDVASLWFIHGKFSLYDKTTQSTVGAATYEHHTRFFGHGIGYVAYGLGVSTGDLFSSGIRYATTTGLGIDIGHFFLDARSLNFGWGGRSLFALLVGGRF